MQSGSAAWIGIAEPGNRAALIFAFLPETAYLWLVAETTTEGLYVHAYPSHLHETAKPCLSSMTSP